MTQENLLVGIAGYGTVGNIRHRVADLHPKMRTVAVCDQKFTSSGINRSGIRCYGNYKQLLEEPLDVLFVCLPNYLAPEVTIAGLEHRLHVFCEKPPGRNLTDIVSVMECERRNPGQKLMYGFNHRYHDSFRDALRIVGSGELGQVINMRGIYGKSKIIRFDSNWRTRRSEAGGGILLDQGIHMVDMMRLLARQEFTEIHSFISNNHWRHDVEDNAYAMMRTDGGIVAMLHSSATQWRHSFRLEITLTRGAMVLAGILSGTKSYGAETITVIYPEENDGGDPREQMTRYNQDNSWRDEIFDFADAIINDKPIVDGSSTEAFRTTALVYGIYFADPLWRSTYNIPNPANFSL